EAAGKIQLPAVQGWGAGQVWYAVNANVGWSLVLSGLVSTAVIWRVFALDLNLSVKCLVATATLVGSAILAVIVGTMS
ncbi:hypothetical protein, partial [Rhodovulum viride]|uniref:hypothetical protein n=1 Tax=Rhodovulum viride TaxID=1231134 RepID=UPI001C65AE80